MAEHQENHTFFNMGNKYWCNSVQKNVSDRSYPNCIFLMLKIHGISEECKKNKIAPSTLGATECVICY